MPGSSRQGKSYSAGIILSLEKKGLIRRVIDVGVGAGTYAQFLKPSMPNTHWSGIEAYQPYITHFQLDKLYDLVVTADARYVDWKKIGDADLIIFGDIVEHMTRDEAVSMVGDALNHARFVMLSMPVVFYPQDEAHGNPFERHIVDDWDHGSILKCFPGIRCSRTFAQIGVYFLARDQSDQSILAEAEASGDAMDIYVALDEEMT